MKKKVLIGRVKMPGEIGASAFLDCSSHCNSECSCDSVCVRDSDSGGGGCGCVAYAAKCGLEVKGE